MEVKIIILGWVGAILTSITLIPQSYKIIKTKNTAALSLYMYIIYIISTLIWLIFSLLTKQYYIAVTNTIVLILASIILILKTTNIIKKGEKP